MSSTLLAAEAPAEITLSLSAADGLDRMAAPVKTAVNQDNCPSCHSGFDWSFGRSAEFTLGSSGRAR
ncbi:hypothetical protein F4556_006696 [Kitasatospora gansuensis]|uniref:Uncharacterized protein n=1 Tax=Kitasatospora gansuensis TaxID=258050 RepID=A0A7W7SKV6_9ACTN|nr:hypothetical protein [Kitasatospora gansuensis]MBB4951161.1 hypothetical protein [Kitasatospora gansuensis]